jgi:hypothetical protein
MDYGEYNERDTSEINMNDVFPLLQKHGPWIFSGIGLVVLSGTVWAVRKAWNLVWARKAAAATTPAPNDTERLKHRTNILFIDDDTRFKVISILKTAGWLNTQILKDVTALSDSTVAWAHILFIDINGVGKKLGFQDEGLGLALAIKERFPAKKVVIYSADTRAERFHEAWRKADEYLAKNSDPYQFEQIVEEFARSVHR